MLEALALLHAVRSFRTTKLSPLVKNGEKFAQILCKVERENQGESEVLIEITSSKRRILVDGIEQKTLGEFIGKFPVMAVSNDDIKLVRGAPNERRKFADILISSISLAYFNALKNYHNALTQRNKLLKDENSSDDLFEAFEFEMAKNAVLIDSIREQELAKLGDIAAQKYAILSSAKEEALIRLKPDFPYNTQEEYISAWQEERAKDRILKSTSSGPHKDDFSINIANKNAKEFASEGQQRSVALSLKLAEFEVLKNRQASLPVLLCDDILGELDSSRRAAFWECIDKNVQVIATSTTLPESQTTTRKDWKIIHAQNGKYYEA